MLKDGRKMSPMHVTLKGVGTNPGVGHGLGQGVGQGVGHGLPCG